MERQIELIVFGDCVYHRKGTGYDYDNYEQKSNLCYAVGVGGCRSITGDWMGYTKRTNQIPPNYRVEFKDGSYTTVEGTKVLKLIVKREPNKPSSQQVLHALT